MNKLSIKRGLKFFHILVPYYISPQLNPIEKLSPIDLEWIIILVDLKRGTGFRLGTQKMRRPLVTVPAEKYVLAPCTHLDINV